MPSYISCLIFVLLFNFGDSLSILLAFIGIYYYYVKSIIQFTNLATLEAHSSVVLRHSHCAIGLWNSFDVPAPCFSFLSTPKHVTVTFLFSMIVTTSCEWNCTEFHFLWHITFLCIMSLRFICSVAYARISYFLKLA